MKLILFAVALTIAGAASAQKAPDTSPQTTGNPPGGYQPTSGSSQPGQPAVFVPNPQTPSEAYPPPPPLQHYPYCKRGQFDHCMQRGG